MRILGTLTLILLMIAGCRLHHGPQSEISSFNSSRENGEPAVLKILSRFPVLDEQGNQKNDEEGFPVYRSGDCSMTAYAPNAAVTAAHCVLDPDTGDIVDPTKKNLIALLPDNSHFFAKRVAVHPGYVTERKDENGNVTTDGSGRPSKTDPSKDLAIIEFGNYFQQSKKLSPLTPEANKSKIKIVGFGLRGFYLPPVVEYLMPETLTDVENKYLDDIRVDDPGGADLLVGVREVIQLLKQEKKVPDDNPFKKQGIRFKENFDRIDGSMRDENGHHIKRSGKTTLGGIVDEYSAFTDSGHDPSADGLLVFTGKFIDSVFKDDLDKELFNKFGLYAPTESDTNATEGGLSASFGDSGGPMLMDDGTLVGVLSSVSVNIDNRISTSVYVNLRSQSSQQFLKEQAANGFPLPTEAEIAAGNTNDATDQDNNVAQDPAGDAGQQPSTPTPRPRQNNNLDGPVPSVNRGLAAKLASRPNPAGIYHLLISTAQTADQIWICENESDLRACNNFTKATATAGRSQVGPQTRHNYQTDQPIDINNTFVIMTRSGENVLSGTVVQGVKR